VGLDPSTVTLLSSILQRLARLQSPRIILSLNSDEHLPDWITHVMFLLHGHKVHSQGAVSDVADALADTYEQILLPGKEASVEDSKFIDDASRMFHTRIKGPTEGSKRIRWKRETSFEYAKAWRKKRLYTDESSALVSSDGVKPTDNVMFTPGEAIVQMDGIKVAYGDRPVLGDWKQNDNGTEKEGLWWTIRRGERWGVFGPNGMLAPVSPPL
jgi:hypothetical protein